jgi:hypothetical protein
MRDRDLIDGTPADPRRFWCSYIDLEEYHAGMWRSFSKKSELELIAKSVALLRSSRRFGVALDRVLSEWPTSCRAEFTSPGNHLAWLAHAAASLVRNIPEEFMRLAYWELSLTDRERADRDAIEIAAEWRDPRA